MDGEWRFEGCAPSSPRGLEWNVPPQALNHIVKDCQKTTSLLKDTPYDPTLWLQRANCLMCLGYPELATSDLYKSYSLCCDGLIHRDNFNDLRNATPDQRRCLAVIQHFGERFYGQKNWKNIFGQDPGQRDVYDAEKYVLLLENLKELRAMVTEMLVVVLCETYCYISALEALDAEIALAGAKLPVATPEGTLQSLKEKRAEVELAFQEWKAVHVESVNAGSDQLQTCGLLFRRKYPWMTPVDLTRSQDLIEAAQTQFDSASSSRTCTVNVSPAQGSRATDEIYVFAARPIHEGELLFTDNNMLAIQSNRNYKETLCDYCFTQLHDAVISASCCCTFFCSLSCKEKSLRTYHKVLCGVSLPSDNGFFSPVKTIAKGSSPATNNIATTPTAVPSLNSHSNTTNLLARLFATYLQNPSTPHPLSHPVLSRWKPDLRTDRPIRNPFSFDTHVRRPIAILEALGVDVYADHRFDAWVIIQLINRIEANAMLREAPLPAPAESPSSSSAASAHGEDAAPGVSSAQEAPSASASASQSPVSVSRRSSAGASCASSHRPEAVAETCNLSYLCPFFNHSCVPNLSVAFDRGGIVVRARRNIAAQEELCVSYIQEGLSSEQRKEALKAWFTTCWCPLCGAEADLSVEGTEI